MRPQELGRAELATFGWCLDDDHDTPIAERMLVVCLVLHFFILHAEPPRNAHDEAGDSRAPGAVLAR